jgi:hypothetical protein
MNYFTYFYYQNKKRKKKGFRKIAENSGGNSGGILAELGNIATLLCGGTLN